jgi:hypothetical protein
MTKKAIKEIKRLLKLATFKSHSPSLSESFSRRSIPLFINSKDFNSKPLYLFLDERLKAGKDRTYFIGGNHSSIFSVSPTELGFAIGYCPKTQIPGYSKEDLEIFIEFLKDGRFKNG